MGAGISEAGVRRRLTVVAWKQWIGRDRLVKGTFGTFGVRAREVPIPPLRIQD